MITTDVAFSGTWLLSDLEKFAEQQEEILGPLVNLGNAGADTVLTFNMSDLPPATFVILRTTIGGATPVVPGFSLVCQGNCLIGGRLTGVAALRSDADKSAVPSVVPGSAVEQALKGELPAALKYRDLIVHAAAAKGISPAVIAAIGSIESGWGTGSAMQPNGPSGTGDRAPRAPKPPLRPGSMPTDGLGFGRGLMQIDWDSFEFARTGNWSDAAANIAFGCNLFAENRDGFMQNGLNADDAVVAAIAAYNAGFSGASAAIKNEGLKAATGPGTYASKVLDRVAFFRSNGFDKGVQFMLAKAPGGGPYIASNAHRFLGQSVGNGQCVAFVRAAANAPATTAWRKGDLVKGNMTIQPGTAIATFDANGHYGNHTDGRSHAAIYLEQSDDGISVLDQWAMPEIQPVHPRTIKLGQPLPVNNGNKFYIIV